MPHYHVLVFGDDGQVARTYAIDAPSDAEALARLQGAHSGESVEVWNGERMIRRLRHGADQGAP